MGRRVHELGARCANYISFLNNRRRIHQMSALVIERATTATERTRHGMAWYDLVWLGMAWHGMQHSAAKRMRVKISLSSFFRFEPHQSQLFVVRRPPCIERGQSLMASERTRSVLRWGSHLGGVRVSVEHTAATQPPSHQTLPSAVKVSVTLGKRAFGAKNQ